jgi:hypothetical protein
VPVVSAGLLQPLTSLGFGLFGHVTRPGFPLRPRRRELAAAHGPQPAACAGIAINITYGSSGRKGTLGAPGKLTFNPSMPTRPARGSCSCSTETAARENR